MTAQPLRIAVAGNQWITRYLIRSLRDNDAGLSLIINLPPTWAVKISGYEDLAVDAKEVGAELYRPETYSLMSAEDQRALSTFQMDLLFVFGWQRLIPEWLLERSRLGAYGVHGGPERPPRCRGRAVFNWALILGYEEFHLYAFRLTKNVDDGDILGATSFDILPEDDILTLYHKNCVVSTRLFLEISKKASENQLNGCPQSSEGATYLPKRLPENGGISWGDPAKRIVNLVRALAPPYPGAFTQFRDMVVKVSRAQVFDHRIKYQRAVPGTILDTFPNGDFIVQSGDDPVYIREWSSPESFVPNVGDKFLPSTGISLPDPVL